MRQTPGGNFALNIDVASSAVTGPPQLNREYLMPSGVLYIHCGENPLRS